MARWEYFLAKEAIILLIVAGLGPFLGRANLAQTILLSLILSLGLFFLGDLLLLPRVLSLTNNLVAAAGDGLAAAVAIRYLAPAIGAAFGWTAALVLGAAVGVSEYYLHHWEDLKTHTGRDVV